MKSTLKKAAALMGQRVRWERLSQEGEGVVISVVAPDGNPNACVEYWRASSKQKAGNTLRCNYPRVIIRVDRYHQRTGQPIKPIYVVCGIVNVTPLGRGQVGA
jgi:hypothetical protein